MSDRDDDDTDDGEEFDEERIKRELMEAAEQGGVDPEKVKDTKIHVIDRRVQFKMGAAELSLPAPSQAAVDSLLKRYGGQIVTTLLTLAAVAVGTGLAIATGAAGSGKGKRR
jgi:hypothetical protein